MHAIVDTHCHLDLAVFDDDRADVLKACYHNSVSDIVVPSVSQTLWKTTIELCASEPKVESSPDLHLALGLHPIFIEQHQPQHLNELDELVGQHRPIAIGEIGLDFHLKNEDKQPREREKQVAFFTKQLIIAKQHQLPAIIHCRKAHDDCVKLLQDVGPHAGVIHNFNGSIQHAYKYIEMGFKLGFGGMLTFHRSRVLRNLAKQIPLEAIVLETDAPDLTVAAHQGERNSPAYLPHVLDSLAEIKSIPVKTVAETTTHNAKQVLGLA